MQDEPAEVHAAVEQVRGPHLLVSARQLLRMHTAAMPVLPQASALCCTGAWPLALPCTHKAALPPW